MICVLVSLGFPFFASIFCMQLSIVRVEDTGVTQGNLPWSVSFMLWGSIGSLCIVMGEELSCSFLPVCINRLAHSRLQQPGL